MWNRSSSIALEKYSKRKGRRKKMKWRSYLKTIQIKMLASPPNKKQTSSLTSLPLTLSLPSTTINFVSLIIKVRIIGSLSLSTSQVQSSASSNREGAVQTMHRKVGPQFCNLSYLWLRRHLPDDVSKTRLSNSC